MDLCRNVIVSGGLTSECQPDQLFSSSCSKIGSLDDLFSSHNMVEAGNDDVGLEWLSIFIEDCLTSSGNCLPVSVVPTNITNEVDEKKTTSGPSAAVSSKSQRTSNTRFDGRPNMFVITAGKGARSKRKRIAVAKSKSKAISSSSSWSGRHIPLEVTGCCSSVDPPLLQQTYWLADSELIFPRNDDDDDDDQEGGRSRSTERSAERDGKEVVVLLEEVVGGEEEEEVMGKEGNNDRGRVSNGQQQGRRCSHCLSQRTPQWRAGPLGPKTLCNACGVRYKSGRLLPEYRPAKSPTFVSNLHSNSHKKVLKMRQSIRSSHSSS